MRPASYGVPGGSGGAHVPLGVAQDERGRPGDPAHRRLDQIRVGLGAARVGPGEAGVGEGASVEQVQVGLDVLGIARAGQHHLHPEPVAQVDEQFRRLGQGDDLAEQRVELLLPGGAGVVAVGVLEPLTGDGGDNVLVGGDGGDTLDGGDGADSIDGGAAAGERFAHDDDDHVEIISNFPVKEITAVEVM